MLVMKVCSLIFLFTLFDVGFSRPAITPAEYERRFNQTVECVRQMYNEGKPEIGLQKHDPLIMKNYVINFDVFGIDFLHGNVSFNNLTFYDVTKFTLSHVEATDVSDPESPSFHIVMEWPVYRLESEYDINLKVKETSVTGKGKLEESITKYKYDFNFKTTMPLTRDNFNMKFSFDDLTFHMDELLVNGKDIIGDIKNNLKSRIDQIKQNPDVINKSITDFIIKFVNMVYAAKMYNKQVIDEIANCWKSSV